MAQISSSTGLISGINYGDIINQLMALEQRPVNNLQSRIDNITQQKLAFTDLTARLTALRLTGTTLKKKATFQNATASSSNENVLTATTSSGAAIGTYQFQVARLVTTQQTVSRGFADFSSAKLAAGNITLELGGGELSQSNSLADLRGGAGVSRGLFKLTDHSGATAVIDTTAAVTLDDVIKKINTNLDISVKATISGDQIVLTDQTGKSASNLIVQDIGDGKVAADLGIVGSTATNSITGTDINFLGTNTSVQQINDGRGLRTASSGADLNLHLADGTSIDVTLAASKTIGDVINAINTAAGTKLTASIDPGSNGLKLTDNTTGSDTFAVTALNSSKAASDLGILATGSAGVINGSPVLAGLGTVLISSLNGGAGFSLGTISIQSRAAVSGTSINLSGAKSVADVLNTINNAGAGVTASLNSSGNGIQIVDSSGGTGNIVISDVSGTTAADFGLAGSFGTTVASVNGANLQRQWVSENTLLADYNGGNGVTPGKFKVTDSTGKSATIDLTQGNEIRLTNVIQEINSKGIGVVASINAHGDGLLLTDTAGGTQKLKVEDSDGTTAANLHIAGTATGTTIDGTMEKTIAVTANDTLSSLQTKINDLNWGVTASIINDGSTTAPYRLALNAKNSGLDGRVVVDAGTTGLGTQTLVQAQNAAVFVGGVGASQPLLITSSKNQLAGIITGVNISLNGISDSPITLSITRNVDNVVDQINTFVQNFNDMTDKIADLTKWDTTNNTGGLLLGDSTVSQVQTELYNALQAVNPEGGRYRILSDIGLTLTDGAKLAFDEDKFRTAYSTDPDAVQQLFTAIDSTTVNGTTTTTTPGLGYTLESTISDLIDPVTGVIPRENNSLDQQTVDFQTRITQLNALIDQKRTRLQTQFANLESVLAGLQTQQKSIASITSISTAAK
ncbi:MAG TPA: flagellar filament capping protein FliD [Tepidisphaeraceae bacterium]|nr:flagellar filament capping protein FliD [Tepidisphaeraceae bacterium]